MLHCHEWLNVYYSLNMFRWKPSQKCFMLFSTKCAKCPMNTIQPQENWYEIWQNNFLNIFAPKSNQIGQCLNEKKCHNYLILCSKVHLCLPECLVATRRGVSNTLTTAEIMEQRVSFLVMKDSKSCGRNPSIFRQKQCAIMLCEYAILHTAMQTWTNVIVQSYWTTVFGACLC